MSTISDKTVVPLGIAVAIIGSATWWIATQAATLRDTVEDVGKIKTSRELNQIHFTKVLNRLDRRVFEIQLKLGIKTTNEEGD